MNNKKNNLRVLIHECITEVLHDRHIRRQQKILKVARKLTIEMKEIVKKEFGV